MSAQSKRDILGYIHVRPKREVLKHHPNAAGPRGDENLSRTRNDVSTNAYVAGVWCYQAGNKKQGRRFAAT
jgi:hypothetical protein